MASQPIPVVLLGRTENVGRLVTDNLKPEYEVIHSMGGDMNIAKEDLPLLLAGSRPNNATFEGVGSGDYSKHPEAVITGAWFTNAMVEELRGACTATNVPWVIAGVTEEQRDAAMKSAMLPPTAYAPEVAGKVKAVLNKIRDDGKWEADGVYTQ